MLSDGSVAGTTSFPLAFSYRYIGTSEYLRATARTWKQTGYSSSVASRLANHWVVAHASSNSLLKGLGVTSLPLVAKSITAILAKPAHALGDRELLGVQVEGVRSSAGTIWISTGSDRRPVELVVDGGRAVVKFGEWNATSSLSVPAGAIPLPRPG